MDTRFLIIMSNLIPVYKPSLAGNENKYVAECLASSWISSRGKFIELFEKSFAEYISIEHATAVSNGTVAIHLALEALGIGVGDEVILPTFTYVASANAIVYTGATPVFVDSLPDTWQIDPADIVKKITPRTKAIMAVHLYGQPCEMDTLVRIAKSNNLFLIEDCAEAFGTKYKSRFVGTFGDISTFSFFGNKTITTGEGGMVVAHDAELMKRCNRLKSQGVSPAKEYWHDMIAYNYRMTNICAAIGLAQLERADEIIAKKQQIAKWYQDGLKDLPVKFHNAVGDVFHSYWMCSILVDKKHDRDQVRKNLLQAGIETRPLFYPVNTMPMYYKEGEHFPVAENLGSRGMNLPSWPELTKEQVDYIVKQLAIQFEQTNHFSVVDRESC